MTLKASGISAPESQRGSSGEGGGHSQRALSVKSLEDSLAPLTQSSPVTASPLQHPRADAFVLSRETFNKKVNFEWGKAPGAQHPRNSPVGSKGAKPAPLPLKELKSSQENLSPSFSLRKYLFSKRGSSERKKPKSVFDCLQRPEHDIKSLKERIGSPGQLSPDTFTRLSTSHKADLRAIDLKEALARMSPKLMRSKTGK